MRRRRAGFTLLEVLLAVFVLATAMSALVVMLTNWVHRLGIARTDAEAMTLAELRLREMAGQARLGELIEPGVSEGQFDEPYEQMYWQLEVEPYPVPLAEPTPERVASSSLFAPGGRGPNEPQPSVRRLVMRVYQEDTEVEDAHPFVMFLVEPALPPAQDGEPPGTAPGLSPAEGPR